MQSKFFTMLAGTFFLAVAQAQVAPNAYRRPDLSHEHYERLYSKDIKNVSFSLQTTPLRGAKLYVKEELPNVKSWSAETLQERFEKMRDARFLIRKGEESFPRRIPWLYPADGCWGRAAMAIKSLFDSYVPLPDKVFVFGNLSVKTPYSHSGYVSWWYHTAPIVQVNGERFVLDPSIEVSKPLELEEWMGRMGDASKMKIKICGSGTYSPSDSCEKETDGLEERGEQALTYYLDLEKKLLQNIGRNIDVELGDNPPW